MKRSKAEGAPGKRRQESDSVLRKLFRRRFIPFSLIAGIVFFALCTRSYLDQLGYAFAFVSLNYAEASKGLAPNETRYNMYDFKSRALMEKVIDMAALDDVTAEDLSNCVGISTRGSGGSEYISTGYTLSLNLGALEGMDVHIDAKSLLDLIAKAYTQMFYDQCVERADALLFSLDDTADYEYKELADYYELKLQLLDNYVSARILENDAFESEQTSLTFKDVRERINNIRSVDLVKVNAYINNAGVVANRDAYLAKLAYVNYRNSEKYWKSLSQYKVWLENVALYDILQSATVMVPTYDADGEFYMSMTKTGVDGIAISAQKSNAAAALLKATIDDTDYTIARVLASSGDAGDQAIVSAMLDALKEKIDEITRLTLLTDSDYISYKTDNYITFTESRLSNTEKIEFTSNAVKAFLVYAALWLIAYNRLVRKERKIV